MPIYMDTHERVRAITPEGLTRAYERILEIQGKYGVRYLKLWVSYEPGRMFCLLEAPSKEAALLVHRESHGILPNEIIEVVEAPQEMPLMGQGHSERER